MGERTPKPDLDNQFLEAVAYLGESLGPLFLYDPAEAEAAPLYSALMEITPEEAAANWPFADQASVLSAFQLIHESLDEPERSTSQTGSTVKPDSVPENIVWEYRRLFAGPGTKAAPPWGSVYTDRECVVFGETTLALRQWMRQNGISRPGDGTEPEDHIGLMLLLMSWIARNRPDLLKEYLTDHLLSWGPHFLQEMGAVSNEPFFDGLALLTLSSLTGVRESLDLDVSEPRFYR